MIDCDSIRIEYSLLEPNGKVTIYHKEGTLNCCEAREFEPPVQISISNLDPNYHTRIGFYLRNKHEPDKIEDAFMSSNTAITTNRISTAEIPIERETKIILKLKPILRFKYTLSLWISNVNDTSEFYDIVDLIVVSDRTRRHQVNGRNIRPNSKYIELQSAYNDLYQKYIELQSLFHTYVPNFIPHRVPSMTIRGQAHQLKQDLIRINFPHFTNNKWVDFYPKDPNGNVFISSAMSQFNFEETDPIRLEVTNLHSFCICFIVQYKPHWSKKFSRLDEVEPIMLHPKSLEKRSDGKSMSIQKLRDCQFPEGFSKDQVPAVDTYAFTIWSPEVSGAMLNLTRKVYIYNKNQAKLEELKAKEQEEKLQQELDPVDDSPEEQITGNIAQLKITTNEISTEKLNKGLKEIGGLGFPINEQVIKKLKEFEGDVSKTVNYLAECM